MIIYHNFKQALDPMTKQSTEELVTLGDVYNEFNAYVTHTTRMKKVTKNFAFNVPGVQVPPTCEYMQV